MDKNIKQYGNQNVSTDYENVPLSAVVIAIQRVPIIFGQIDHTVAANV